jgi:cytochrome P450
VAEALHAADQDSLMAAMARAALPDGSRMSPEALRNEAVTLFLAVHETTANIMAWVWFLLSQDAASASRLRAEARAALGGRAAGHADLPALPFTRAVVEETLRLYPPIPLLGREAQFPFTLAGHAVPKGALVLAVPWLLLRNPRFWAEPDSFRPERFLPEAPPPPRHAFIPFSLGPRVCTGAAFALAEAVICLATLAQEFAPALVPGTGVQPLCRLTLRPGDRLPMQLVPAP